MTIPITLYVTNELHTHYYDGHKKHSEYVNHVREAFKRKTAIIVTLSLSHFTPTLPEEIGTVIIGTKSM